MYIPIYDIYIYIYKYYYIYIYIYICVCVCVCVCNREVMLMICIPIFSIQFSSLCTSPCRFCLIDILTSHPLYSIVLKLILLMLRWRLSFFLWLCWILMQRTSSNRAAFLAPPSLSANALLYSLSEIWRKLLHFPYNGSVRRKILALHFTAILALFIVIVRVFARCLFLLFFPSFFPVASLNALGASLLRKNDWRRIRFSEWDTLK